MRRSAMFSILCSVWSIFKPSTSFAALSHNICFVMARINHHQKQPGWLLRQLRPHLLPPLSPFILDSFINAIEWHLQRSQPQVGSKLIWVERRSGRAHLIWTTSQTKQAATPPKLSHSHPSRPSYATHPSQPLSVRLILRQVDGFLLLLAACYLPLL